MNNQRVLVTAGAAGIGREIVRAFAAGGATVFVCDIDAQALRALAGEIVGLKMGVCDVSRRNDIERMFGEAVQALGGLDVLVNNAGIAGPTAPVEDMDPDCQTALKRDPGSASNRDPSRALEQACPGSQREDAARSGATATSLA